MNATFFYWGPLLVTFDTPKQVAKDILVRFKNETNVKSANYDLASIIEDTKFILSEESKRYFVNLVLDQYLEQYCSILFNEYNLFNEKERTTSKTFQRMAKRKVKLLDLWINTQKTAEVNPVHIHSDDISFVYYLQIPETIEQERAKYEGTSPGPGSITFQYGEPSNAFWSRTAHTFFPVVGQLFIFPSKLQHYVQPFYGSGERISVSGNLIFLD
jgi:hypothetical protein